MRTAVAVAVVAVLAVLAGGCGDEPLGPTVTDPDGLVEGWSWQAEPRPIDTEDGSLPIVIGGRDPEATTVTLHWGGLPCEGSPLIDVAGSGDELRFDIDAGPTTNNDCEAMEEFYWLTLDLAEPVGGREVVLTHTPVRGPGDGWRSTDPPERLPAYEVRGAA